MSKNRKASLEISESKSKIISNFNNNKHKKTSSQVYNNPILSNPNNNVIFESLDDKTNAETNVLTDPISNFEKEDKLEINNNQNTNIRVLCRFRPLNQNELKIQQTKQSSSLDEFNSLCVRFLDLSQVEIKSSAENNSKYKFNFDRIFSPDSHQKEIYEAAAKPIVSSVLEGFNGTIFAYGQTGSGKTFTMSGIYDNIDLEGIVPRMVNQVFSHIISSSEEIEYTVKISAIEIYMEKVKDLIDTSKVNLNIREDKYQRVFVENLSEHYVASPTEVLDLIKLGNNNRSVAKTNMNDQSSRSHSIVIVTISQTDTKSGTAKSGKLFLVDLAGSEKISKTGATGVTLDEAKTINKSLTTLGMVINCLSENKNHIPYRESKLTRILSESLGGNAKTCLIITCSPSPYNESESLSTLRFGMRAKKVKNKPKINKELTVSELKIIVEKLERQLKLSNMKISQLEKYIKSLNIEMPNNLIKLNEIDKDIDEIGVENSQDLSITENNNVNKKYRLSNMNNIDLLLKLEKECAYNDKDLLLININNKLKSNSTNNISISENIKKNNVNHNEINIVNTDLNSILTKEELKYLEENNFLEEIKKELQKTNVSKNQDNLISETEEAINDNDYYETQYFKLNDKYNDFLLKFNELEESKNSIFEQLQETNEEINTLKDKEMHHQEEINLILSQKQKFKFLNKVLDMDNKEIGTQDLVFIRNENFALNCDYDFNESKKYQLMYFKETNRIYEFCESNRDSESNSNVIDTLIKTKDIICCEIEDIKELDNDELYYFIKDINSLNDDIYILSQEEFENNCKIVSNKDNSNDNNLEDINNKANYKEISSIADLLKTKGSSNFKNMVFFTPSKVIEAKDPDSISSNANLSNNYNNVNTNANDTQASNYFFVNNEGKEICFQGVVKSLSKTNFISEKFDSCLYISKKQDMTKNILSNKKTCDLFKKTANDDDCIDYSYNEAPCFTIEATKQSFFNKEKLNIISNLNEINYLLNKASIDNDIQKNRSKDDIKKYSNCDITVDKTMSLEYLDLSSKYEKIKCDIIENKSNVSNNSYIKNISYNKCFIIKNDIDNSNQEYNINSNSLKSCKEKVLIENIINGRRVYIDSNELDNSITNETNKEEISLLTQIKSLLSINDLDKTNINIKEYKEALSKYIVNNRQVVEEISYINKWVNKLETNYHDNFSKDLILNSDTTNENANIANKLKSPTNSHFKQFMIRYNSTSSYNSNANLISNTTSIPVNSSSIYYNLSSFTIINKKKLKVNRINEINFTIDNMLVRINKNNTESCDNNNKNYKEDEDLYLNRFMKAHENLILKRNNNNNKICKSELLLVSIPKSSIDINNKEVSLFSTDQSDQEYILKEKIKKIAEEKEHIKRDKKKFDNEKKLILKSLEEKIDKIKSLEFELKDYKEKLKILESSINQEDKTQIKKILSLERTLEQVNMLYHQAITQKSVLKIENQVNEKKLKKRDDKIIMLNKEISEFKENLKALENKYISLKSNLINNSMSGSALGNVKKIIKGQGKI